MRTGLRKSPSDTNCLTHAHTTIALTGYFTFQMKKIFFVAIFLACALVMSAQTGDASAYATVITSLQVREWKEIANREEMLKRDMPLN